MAMNTRQDRLPCTLRRPWLLLMAACVAGCGAGRAKSDYSMLDLVEVSGTVTMDDRPLEGATVVFEDAERRTSTGTTDAAGRYTLMYTTEKSGVTPGTKTVRIRYGGGEGSDGDGAEGEDDSGKPLKPKRKIPEKYNSKSELTREVKSGGPQTFDFDLKSG
jgi:hypothetical protein